MSWIEPCSLRAYAAGQFQRFPCEPIAPVGVTWERRSYPAWRRQPRHFLPIGVSLESGRPGGQG
jgi:hypothetical protein